MPSLTRAEARARKALLTVESMRVDLDLDRGSAEFGSATTVAFRCAEPGASTFADLRAREVTQLELNGRPLDPGTIVDGRLPLSDLAPENTLRAVTTMAYSHDGSGLHRATDPADGLDYVYGHLFLDAAPTVFACFDQPDLKAPYAVTVRVPEDWTVLGNGAARRTGPGEWELATTLPLATYFVTVCAGPWASVRAEHDGIPLGVHARASLAPVLEAAAPQVLEVTRQSFDEYHRLFGIRYPFGEYHQVFVPEFNAGAMENPGCVTLRDDYLSRGAPTRDRLLLRSNTVAHELAHQWFGDLVTMAWWDDLWLNESFAEYMSHRVLTAATEFGEAWVDSTVIRKAWGYAAERTPTTHPVAGSPAEDAASALQNFDGISYAKGSAALRQLIAHVGDDAFIAGVTAYLRELAYGNGELADFIGAIERSSGKDLGEWSEAWLRTAGLDRIAVDPATGTVTRTAPEDHPADRTHTLDVAGFTDGAEAWRTTVTLDGPSVRAEGAAPAQVVVPNASDLTWAVVDLDPATLAALPRSLRRVPDVQARGVVWTALLDGVCYASVDPRHYLAVVAGSWPHETDASILAAVSERGAPRVLASFLPEAERDEARGVLASAAEALLARAEPGSTRAHLAATFLARFTADASLLRAWAAGDSLPSGLEGDADFRWYVLIRLAHLGLLTREDVDAEEERDRTMNGRLSALSARAVLPGPEDKARAWEQLVADPSASNHELNALARTFFRSGGSAVLEPYAERWFTDLPRLAERVGDDAMQRVALLSYPTQLASERLVAAAAQALARTDLTPAVRRVVLDSDALVRQVLASRRAFPESAQGAP